MQTCLPYLHEQIDLIRPQVIVALGATAVEGLLGKTVGITKLRGQWQTYRGTPLMPTYHPAYLLRNQAMSEKRRVARSGRSIDLGPTEYRLLEFFLEHPGRVFSREQLLDIRLDVALHRQAVREARLLGGAVRRRPVGWRVSCS
ncbi:hypothetical protein B4Q13_23620 [Lacticaseibacillus rhamnosus]